MARIKKHESSFAIRSEWTSWYYHRGYNYYTGIVYTSNGFIQLYYQPKDQEDNFYATARITYKGRIYDLYTDDEVTRLGWIRIAKNWARNIWS